RAVLPSVPRRNEMVAWPVAAPCNCTPRTAVWDRPHPSRGGRVHRSRRPPNRCRSSSRLPLAPLLEQLFPALFTEWPFPLARLLQQVQQFANLLSGIAPAIFRGDRLRLLEFLVRAEGRKYFQRRSRRIAHLNRLARCPPDLRLFFGKHDACHG